VVVMLTPVLTFLIGDVEEEEEEEEEEKVER
jgi:hypothetical protein